MHKKKLLSVMVGATLISGALDLTSMGAEDNTDMQNTEPANTENLDNGSGEINYEQYDGMAFEINDRYFEYLAEARKRLESQFGDALMKNSIAYTIGPGDSDNGSGRVKIRMVGDCIMHSPLYKSAKQEDGAYNFDNMFENVKEDIQAADISIINQETIFVDNESEYSSSPEFGTPEAVGDAEAKAGFNVVTHATEHAMDKGEQGILNTLDFWDNYSNVRVLGIHRKPEDSDIVYMNKNGIRIALVSYTQTKEKPDETNGTDGKNDNGADENSTKESEITTGSTEENVNGEEAVTDSEQEQITDTRYMLDRITDTDIEDNLREAEEKADITIALIHGGTLYEYVPDSTIKAEVDRFIDNGADIVIVTNPHVIQPYCMRTTDAGNQGLVYYSLGNFISNQNEVPRILGGMADIDLVKDPVTKEISIESYDLIPLVTHQEQDSYTVYKLSDYTDELGEQHKLSKDSKINVDMLTSLYDIIINKEIQYETKESEDEGAGESGDGQQKQE